MFKNTTINQILQQLPQVVPNYCDKCGAKHSKEELELIGQEQDKISLRLTCSACGSNYMIQIHNPSEGVFAARKTVSRSDVSVGEAKKFIESDNIDGDEILDVVLALKNVNTLKDFELLFAEEDNTRSAY